jgi:hypothetical protein
MPDLNRNLILIVNTAVYMTDHDLLLKTFLDEGKKNNLDESLLRLVFVHLHDYQFVPMGDRDSIRAELQKIIKRHLGD